MKIARINNLYFYFFLSQLIFLPIHFYQTPLLSSTINTDKAIWLHMIGVFWSAVGYFTVQLIYSLRGEKAEKIEDKSYYFKNIFYVCSYLFIIVGIVINILQVVLYVPIMEYMSKMFSGSYEAGIRDDYLLPSDEGGLPGIIKMFADAPLSIYLMSLGLLNFMKLDGVDTQKLKSLSRVALGGVLVKVFFSIEHKIIMAVLLVNIFLGLKNGYFKKYRYWILIVLLFLMADYLSVKRLEDMRLIDFTLLYFKLGLVNFQLMIETCTKYTYGFSTILSPLYYILKFFNLPSPDFEPYFEWEWNPAQYFSSYAFQDFGYFYFIMFYVVGILLCQIDSKALKQSIYTSAIYFVVLFGIVSFVFVPIIRGLDFWLALLLPCALVNPLFAIYKSTRKHQSKKLLWLIDRR